MAKDSTREAIIEGHMKEVRNYSTDFGGRVEIGTHAPVTYDEDDNRIVGEPRPVIHASADDPWHEATVDLLDLLRWLKQHRPELYAQA